MLTNQQLEQKIEETTAPRVTKEYIESRIKEKDFTRLTDTLTVCIIHLDNGYTVTGESACASPENYRQDIGEKIAYDNAFNKLWPLFGFMLCERLSRSNKKQFFVDMIESYDFSKIKSTKEFLDQFDWKELKKFIGVN